MANGPGIPLSQRQRSAIVQSLLAQNRQPRRNPITAIGAAGQIGASALRQVAANRLLEQQQAEEQAATERNQQAAQSILAALQPSDQPEFGPGGEIVARPPVGDVASRFADTPIGNQVIAGLIQQQLGGGGESFTLSPGQVRFGPGGQPVAGVPAAQRPAKSFFAEFGGEDVRVTEREGQFFVGNRSVSGAELGPATQRVLQGELGQSARDSIQKEIVEQFDVRRDLEALEEFDPREFLSVTGKLRRFGSEVLDRFNLSNEAAQAFLQKDVTFRQNTEALFFKIRKQITGAQAAVQELDQLKESVLSTKLTPAQFEASRNLYLQRVEDAVALRQRLLRQGISPGTDEFGATFDAQFGSVEIPGTTLTPDEQAELQQLEEEFGGR